MLTPVTTPNLPHSAMGPLVPVRSMTTSLTFLAK